MTIPRPRPAQPIVAALICAAISSAAPARAADGNPLHDALGAPDALTIRASIRSRTEAIEGQFRPATAADDLLWSLRTDLFAEYDTGPLRIGAELRDARGYFEKRTSSARAAEINTLEPIQAYVAADLDGVFGKRSTAALTAGRFTLDIGSGRLVAAPDFPNSIVTFTGARFDWHGANKDRVTLFWAMPSTRLPFDQQGVHDNHVEIDRARDAVRFAGGSVTKARFVAGASAEVYAYRLDERDSAGQPTRDRHLLTYGVRLLRAPATGRIDFEVEAARQTGRARATSAATDMTDLPVAAGTFHAEIGRRSAGPWSPRVSLHADYASGDDADPHHYSRFDPLFGAPRVDFGPTALYGALFRTNLVSPGLRIDVVPGKRVDAFVMARALWLAASTDSFAATGVRDVTGRSGRHAGSQIEARVRYWLVPKLLRVEGGGAYLAKGRFLRAAPNAPATGDTRYAYVDVTASF